MAKSPKPQVDRSDLADVEAALTAARAAVDTARQDLANAEALYRDSLLGEDAGASVIAKQAVTAAGVAIDRAVARFDALDKKLKTARTDDEQDRRRRIYSEATKARDELAERLPFEYVEAVDVITSLLRDLAADSKRVEAANKSLPEGVEPLRTAEAQVRDVGGTSEEILSSASVERLVFAESGDILAPDLAAQVLGTGARRTLFAESAFSRRPVEVLARSYREVTFKPAVRGRSAKSLAQTISLPGLPAEAVPFWPPVEGGTSAPGSVPEMPIETRLEPVIALVPDSGDETEAAAA